MGNKYDNYSKNGKIISRKEKQYDFKCQIEIFSFKNYTKANVHKT